jgi:hypothetical protein
MKGFEERKGLLTRIAFDPETGRFVSKEERHPFVQTAEAAQADGGAVIDMPRPLAAGRRQADTRQAIRKIARISARSA